tara:strand:- start:807 stop:1082 length:276 start_codon:yes stop_codon:yes gene_type:complete
MDKEQLKSFYDYSNKRIIDYSHKRTRRSGVATTYWPIQMNTDIRHAIEDRANEEKTDANDWILLQILNGLSAPPRPKKKRTMQEKIDRPGG